MSKQDSRLDNKSKFGELLGGYRSIYEQTALLLVEIEADDKQVLKGKVLTNLDVPDLKSLIVAAVKILVTEFETRYREDKIKYTPEPTCSLNKVQAGKDVKETNKLLQTLLADIE